MDYGRRLGWYAVLRLSKPGLVVETGVKDGLGSAVMLRALQLNAAEGADGRLLAFDNRYDVAWLIPDELRERYDLRIGDSRSLLPGELKDRSVDVFLHDSDHSYDHETFELETVFPHAVAGAVFISDNAEGTAFADFCARHRMRAFLFLEQPHRHVYPGAALGISRYNASET